MSFDDVTADNLVSSRAAIVRSLRSREAVRWPAQRATVDVQECVFLLDAEPRFLLLRLVVSGLHRITVVGVARRSVGLVSVAKDDNVVVAGLERVAVKSAWDQSDV